MMIFYLMAGSSMRSPVQLQWRQAADAMVDKEILRWDKAEASDPDEIPLLILSLRLDEYNRVSRSPESVLN